MCKRGFTRSQVDHLPVNTRALLQKVGVLSLLFSCVAPRKSLITSLSPSVKRQSQLPPFPCGLQMPGIGSNPSHACRAPGTKAAQGMTHMLIGPAARRKPGHHTLWKDLLKRTSYNAQKLLRIYRPACELLTSQLPVSEQICRTQLPNLNSKCSPPQLMALFSSSINNP